MSFNAQHDDDPESYDRLRRGWLNRRRATHFLERVQLASPAVVVEIGSGTGRMLVDLATAFPATRFVGVEPLEDYVGFGRTLIGERGLSNIEILCGTAEDLGLASSTGSVDLVISSDVLHHVRDLQAAVRNVRALLRDGGRWSIVEPNPGNPYVGLFQALTRGERNFWAGRFRQCAEESGFDVQERSRMFLIPAAVDTPPAWLVRAEQRLEHLPTLGGAVTLELVAV